eukprot:gene9267-23822_t
MLLEYWQIVISPPRFDFHPSTVSRLHALTSSVRWERVFRTAYYNWICPDRFPFGDDAYEVFGWMFEVFATLHAYRRGKRAGSFDPSHPGKVVPAMRLSAADFGLHMQRERPGGGRGAPRPPFPTRATA